jgi:hypothetical protein
MGRATIILWVLMMALVLGLYGCQTFESLQPLPPIPFKPSGKDISYVRDVKPVLDRTCIACHACYDAPCQLKLTAAEGVTRGASKDVVYTSARLLIDQWETFLNQPSLKARLSARYLYEHLFLADLYFDDLDALTFYRIVRSASPPGTPVDIIATTRPNDDPGVTFYYRLRRK